MLNAEAEFLRREQEIEEYINHLIGLEQQAGFPVTLINTMKSSTLLMIYNSVESTMTGLLQDVFDHLQKNAIDFNALNDTMKALVLTYTKRRNSEKLVEKMRASALTLVVACFEKNDVFSGNLDCKRIREALKELGVSSKYAYREIALLKVKEERNDLAHGNKSFSDCGKAYTASQLQDIHKRSGKILNQVIRDFEQYLNKKAYA
jgi:hypothetical protein